MVNTIQNHFIKEIIRKSNFEAWKNSMNGKIVICIHIHFKWDWNSDGVDQIFKWHKTFRCLNIYFLVVYFWLLLNHHRTPIYPIYHANPILHTKTLLFAPSLLFLVWPLISFFLISYFSEYALKPYITFRGNDSMYFRMISDINHSFKTVFSYNNGNYIIVINETGGLVLKISKFMEMSMESHQHLSECSNCH